MSKPDLGGPNGLFPPGNPSIEVGGEAPHLFEGLPGPPGPARPQKRTPGSKSQFEGPWQGPNPLKSLSQSLIFGVQTASSLRETHELRWGASPTTSIHRFPGGRGPFGPPNSGLRKTQTNANHEGQEVWAQPWAQENGDLASSSFNVEPSG